jgi:hypothetical protein
MRVPILLLALLAVVACQSDGDPAPEQPDTPKRPAAIDPKAPDYKPPVNVLSEPEREKLYFDLDQYVTSYKLARDENRADTWTVLHLEQLRPRVDANFEELAKAVEKPEASYRQRIAVKSLGFTSQKGQAVKALLPVLAVDRPILLVDALYSLGLLAVPDMDLEPVTNCLAHPDADVRLNACWVVYRVALARSRSTQKKEWTDLRNASGRLLLIVTRKSEDPFVRAHAAAALGAIGDPMAVDVLLNLLKEDDSYLRTRAAEALGQIGEPAAVPPLVEALGRAEGPTEVKVITASIERIAKQQGVPVNRKALGTDPANWRAWLNEVRGRIPPK